MHYTVVASRKVRGELAQIWLAASNRQVVTDASDLIDDHLRRNPMQQAIPFGEFHLHWHPPLAVIYSVFPDDCRVEIRQYVYTG
jgi:hypothetical protein